MQDKTLAEAEAGILVTETGTSMILRIAFGFAISLGLVWADSPAAPDRLIDLSVIALDSHGQPVRDLTADDLQVTDAGKPQKLAFFRFNRRESGDARTLAANQFSNRTGGRRRAPRCCFSIC